MKIPQKPPQLDQLLTNKRLAKLLQLNVGAVDYKERYLHWDKMRHLSPPAEITAHEWWLLTKLARRALYQILPLVDQYQKPFLLALPQKVVKILHYIDNENRNYLRNLSELKTKDIYLTHARIDEAIASSQLEGARTSYQTAKEMLQQNRKPRDHGEQMIYNNYQALQFIRDIKDEPLTLGIIIELQRIVTDKTLSNSSMAGKLRSSSNTIHIINSYQEVLYIPPPAEQLPQRLAALCDFINSDSAEFIHPLIKAIILHFMLTYEHPFIDGNGRTARALFYWYMIKQKYTLIESLSLSHVLNLAPTAYGRAYLYTETDDNDLTYFVLQQLDALQQAINFLYDYLAAKEKKLLELAAKIKAITTRWSLNPRQIALLEHALQRPTTVYRIESHRHLHQIAYDTARSDLQKLAAIGLLIQQQQGKGFMFTIATGLVRSIN